MRIALLMNLAPRKLGSFEGWIEALCRAARGRGHAIDVYGRPPIHAAFSQALREAGVGWREVSELLGNPLRAVRALSGYDVVHLNMFAPRSRMALIAYAALPAKVIFVDHTSDPLPVGGSGRGGRIRQAADRLTVVRVSAFAGVSNFVRDRARARFGLGDRAYTIYNGVDTSRFTPRTRPALHGQLVTVLTAAHLIPEKGVDHLLQALARMKFPARLRVAGDGRESARLAALASALGLEDRVAFLGLRDDVSHLLEDADIFAHPAVWGEAFGFTVAEAMASGLPVVASRVGGIPELIVDGESGLLVPPGDPDALARALERLAARPEERDRLGRGARLRIVARFDLPRAVEGHLALCEKVGGLRPLA